MKTKISSIFFVSMFLTLFISTSCAPAVDEQETATQIPHSVADVPKIPIEELLRLIESDSDIVIVDVRDEEEFIEAHIMRAISLPFAETDTQEWRLPRDKAIVLY